MATAVNTKTYEDVGLVLQNRMLENHGVRNLFEKFEDDYGSIVALAAIRGDSDILKRVIAYGFNTNGRVGSDKTALIISAELCNTKNIKILLDAGCDADARDEDNDNAVMCLLSSWFASFPVDNFCTALNYLIFEGCSLDVENIDGEFALDIAISRCVHPNVIRILLDGGANPNSVSQLGYTPLTSLTWHSWLFSKDYANELFSRGSLPNISRVSPLPATTRDSHSGCELFNLLIENGTDINGVHPQIGTTLLASAIFGRPYMAKIAVELNARINTSDYFSIPYSYLHEPIYKDDEALLIVWASGEDYHYFNAGDQEIVRTMPAEMQNFHQDNSLQNIARKFIRDKIKVANPNVNLFSLIPNIGLPKLLQSYLLFNQSV